MHTHTHKYIMNRRMINEIIGRFWTRTPAVFFSVYMDWREIEFTRRKTSGMYHRLKGLRKTNVRAFLLLTRKKKENEFISTCGLMMKKGTNFVLDVDGMREDRLHEKKNDTYTYWWETHAHTQQQAHEEKKKWLDSKTMSKLQTCWFDCWIVIDWRYYWVWWTRWIRRIGQRNIGCRWERWNWWRRRLLLLLSWWNIGFSI